MIRNVFVTTSVYALAHQVGIGEAMRLMQEHVQAPQLDPKALPCVRTIKRIASLASEGVGLHCDGGATYIGMARSRAFYEAYRSGAPAWITIDDDIDASTATVGAMLAALDDLAPRIIITPYALRAPGKDDKLAMNLPTVRLERQRPAGVKLLQLEPGHGGGMGFVGMNRAAMDAVLEACPPELVWVDEDGVSKRALFYERVEDGLWWGEDTSFFKWRVPSSVSVEALLVGAISHAGVVVDLEKL